jgi:acyl-CoA thioesterase
MSMAEDKAADALARACADAMWAGDRATQALGMKIIDIGAGRATLTMTIRDDMTNGHGMCHGGLIFSLADSAFAFACNSYNQNAVAQHCSVTFIRPGKRGDTLTASAVERSRSGRSGIYDITVTGSDGKVIAEFRGHSRVIEGKLVE